MPNITTCTRCSTAYEAGSEEQANERVRLCFTCRRKWCTCGAYLGRALPGADQNTCLKCGVAHPA